MSLLRPDPRAGFPVTAPTVGRLGESLDADVVVVGGGNAALCAALSARDLGATVALFEQAPAEERGGNSKHTRNIRCVREGGPADQRYGVDEMMADLLGVTADGSDMELARLVVRLSRDVPTWMEAHGARWQPPLRGTLQLSRTNRFFLGGGKALLNVYYDRAVASGASVSYGTRVESLRVEGERVRFVTVRDAHGRRSEVTCRAVVVASGGFEANIEWLKRYWGAAANNYWVRGSPQNDGHVLALLLDAGAGSRGNERGFHAVAVDARSPRFDGGIVTRVDSIPLGIAVNRDGERFYDEGEDIWPKRYATWGGLIAAQPDQIAYSVFDSKAWGLFIPCMYPPLRASTIAELAAVIGVPAAALCRTIGTFNESAWDCAEYVTRERDGRGTHGLTPPKSNWALKLDTPPYYAYPLRPGVTFTYLGVAVDAQARVLRSSGYAFTNLFAAGEVMAGNILTKGYLAGFGMTIGTVFGRIAGEEAARVARA